MNQYQGQSSCIILSISQEAQRAAVLADQPAAAVQVYPLVERGDIAEALALGATVEPDGVVVLRWGVTDPKPSYAAERTCILGQPWLDPRPTDTADALRLIAAARLLARQTAILNRWPPASLTADERAILTAEQAAEVDAQVDERARQMAVREAEEATKEAAIAVARQVAEQAVAGYEVGGAAPDKWVYEYATVGFGSCGFGSRVKGERERRRIRRIAILLNDVVGLADARFHEHATEDRPLGLVSIDEALAILTDWVLPVSTTAMTAESAKTPAKLPVYQPLQQQDARHAIDCAFDRVGFRSCPVNDLTGEEYRAADRTVQRLRATLPLVPVGHPLRANQQSWPQLVRRHVGECECGTSVARLGIEVEVDLGDGVSVEREYGVVDLA